LMDHFCLMLIALFHICGLLDCDFCFCRAHW
jgi:hypothetical protein